MLIVTLLLFVSNTENIITKQITALVRSYRQLSTLGLFFVRRRYTHITKDGETDVMSFIIYTLQILLSYYKVHQITEDEMDGTCTWGR